MDVRWITVFIDLQTNNFDDDFGFWAAVAGSTVSSRRGQNLEFATLMPHDGGDPHLSVQATGPATPRHHIDLHVDEVGASAAECVKAGAVEVQSHGDYVVLRSPGGMAFCVVGNRGDSLRQAPFSTGIGASATLIDQVSIDCDPDLFEPEILLWSTITGWERTGSRGAEFVPLRRVETGPFRIMMQRRSESSGPTSCHLDFACDDVAEEVSRHQMLGASIVEEFELWTVMADPLATPYCLTSRDPRTGQLASHVT